MTNKSSRLTELRRRKGLTRQALAARAHVSERQIARIEAGHVHVRENTVDRLAKALDVDPEVISGTQPLPEAHDEAPSREVDSESLKALRKGKGLSRRNLAHKAKVSERQIARLESGSTRHPVRATTMERLASALGLGADVKKLSGATPVAATQAPQEERRVGLRVSAPLGLAFDLIRFRYGPTPRQVIELAPLLFVLLAEGSLAWRKRHLAAIEEIIGRLWEVGYDTNLGFNVEDLQQGLECERDSIMAADILGDNPLGTGGTGDYPVAYTAEPFAAYLRKMADDIGTEGIVNFDPIHSPVGWPGLIWGAEPYEVCRDKLNELTGGSKYARWALVSGDVRLSEVPKELLKPEAKDDRVAWLESKLSDEGRNRQEAAEALTARVERRLLRTGAGLLPTAKGNGGPSVSEAAAPAGESQ